ncbi:hypothetical protein C0Q70_01341 [Pomacea canaliculata]|uniref:Uncharacterized protein n=1 Tax=Pomacea canaliculata TaxID=400727 RepID=A0A2T7PZ92_POMCA|nr:hypothetical protein C0Q70_01341 [Pomacea canaliculata]
MFCAWISFCLPTWGYDNDSQSSGVMGYGLWRVCGKGASTSGCSDISGTNLDWYGWCSNGQPGLIGVNLALVLVVLQIFVDKCKARGRSPFGTSCSVSSQNDFMAFMNLKIAVCPGG